MSIEKGPPRWPFLVVLVLALTALTATQLPQTTEARPRSIPQPIRRPVLSAPAVVEPASKVIELRSPIQGRLRTLTKQSGDAVAKGEILAELDNDAEAAVVALRRAELLQAQANQARLEAGARTEQRDQVESELHRAEAALEAARIELNRVQTLAARGVSPGYALDAARAEFQMNRAVRNGAKARLAEVHAGSRPEVLAQARAEVMRGEAALELALAQLERTRITSPVDGTCVYRFREPGEVVGRMSDQVPLISVASGGDLRLRADVDASDVDRVWVGQPVEATAPAYAGRTFSGRVLKREPTLGRKNFRTDRPREKIDTKVLEVVILLEDTTDLPLGLEVTVVFLESPTEAGE